MACGYRVVQASPPAVKPSECPVAYSIFLSPASLARNVVSRLTRFQRLQRDSPVLWNQTELSPSRSVHLENGEIFTYATKLN